MCWCACKKLLTHSLGTIRWTDYILRSGSQRDQIWSKEHLPWEFWRSWIQRLVTDSLSDEGIPVGVLLLRISQCILHWLSFKSLWIICFSFFDGQPVSPVELEKWLCMCPADFVGWSTTFAILLIYCFIGVIGMCERWTRSWNFYIIAFFVNICKVK